MNYLKNGFLLLLLSASFLFASCLKDGDETICLVVPNGALPADLVDADLLAEIAGLMPVYDGANPPVVDGEYLVSPVELLHASDGYSNNFYDMTFSFDNQNGRGLLRYGETQGTATGSGSEAHIIGSGDGFTIFSQMEQTNPEGGYSCRMVVVLSGKKTEQGIADLHYAFVMCDREGETSALVDNNVFRIFRDGDGYSEKL